MATYCLTEQGNTFDENGIKVIFSDSHPTFVSYLAFLNNNGEVINYVGIHPSELEEVTVENEYNRYLKRKADGECAYLNISARLRVSKLNGQINDEEHIAVESAIEPVRAEIVLGQWIGGLQKLEAIGSETIGSSFYQELYTIITTYISDNY